MRDWWMLNVTVHLDRLSSDWDTLFLYAWVPNMTLVILAGGQI